MVPGRMTSVKFVKFAAIESAEEVSLEEVLVAVRETQYCVRGTFDLDARFVPTIPELEQSFRDAHFNRGTGPDGIPDEVFAIFARQMSRIYGPLYMKAFLRLDAPIQFAGGILHELFKGSGAGDNVDNWRSILCSNSAGKRMHRVLRPRLF